MIILKIIDGRRSTFVPIIIKEFTYNCRCINIMPINIMADDKDSLFVMSSLSDRPQGVDQQHYLSSESLEDHHSTTSSTGEHQCCQLWRNFMTKFLNSKLACPGLYLQCGNFMIFPISQILREISFGGSRSAKSAILTKL